MPHIIDYPVLCLSFRLHIHTTDFRFPFFSEYFFQSSSHRAASNACFFSIIKFKSTFIRIILEPIILFFMSQHLCQFFKFKLRLAYKFGNYCVNLFFCKHTEIRILPLTMQTDIIYKTQHAVLFISWMRCRTSLLAKFKRTSPNISFLRLQRSLVKNCIIQTLAQISPEALLVANCLKFLQIMLIASRIMPSYFIPSLIQFVEILTKITTSCLFNFI